MRSQTGLAPRVQPRAISRDLEIGNLGGIFPSYHGREEGSGTGNAAGSILQVCDKLPAIPYSEKSTFLDECPLDFAGPQIEVQLEVEGAGRGSTSRGHMWGSGGIDFNFGKGTAGNQQDQGKDFDNTHPR